MYRLFLLPLLAATLSGCGLHPIVVGPADLDTTSAAAPRCGPQQYPFYALENHESGDVVVRAAVDPAGTVTGATLAAPHPSSYLNAAALQGLRACRFAPAAAPREVDVTFAYELVGGDEFLPKGVVRVGVRPPR
jgi:TonB family protein